MRITWLLLALLLVPLLALGCTTRSGRMGDDDDDGSEDDDDSVTSDDDDGADDDDATDDDDGADDDDATDDDDVVVDDDDDNDGVIDCPGTTVSCDSEVGGSTVGSANGSSSWPGCDATDQWTGGEEIFRLTPSSSGSVTFTLTWSDDSQDLDLFVLDDCDVAADCLGSSQGMDTIEEVEANVTAGVPVYVVVDGYNGDASSFQLEVDCGGGGDDDDAGDDEDFVDVTYCLDWSTVNVAEPAGLLSLLQSLAGIDITQYPVLLSANGVNTSTDSIWMLAAAAQMGTCNQDTAYPAVDLTSASPGDYVDPHWEVGPTTLTVPAAGFTITLFDAVLTGDYTATATQIVNGTIEGAMDVPTDYQFACGWMLSCYTCASGVGQCIDFVANSAVYDDNGQGPLIP